jgi:hypothetical protein
MHHARLVSAARSERLSPQESVGLWTSALWLLAAVYLLATFGAY